MSEAKGTAERQVVALVVPADWVGAADDAASKAGVSRAEWIRRAWKRNLPSSVAGKLSAPAPRGRPAS